MLLTSARMSNISVIFPAKVANVPVSGTHFTTHGWLNYVQMMECTVYFLLKKWLLAVTALRYNLASWCLWTPLKSLILGTVVVLCIWLLSLWQQKGKWAQAGRPIPTCRPVATGGRGGAQPPLEKFEPPLGCPPWHFIGIGIEVYSPPPGILSAPPY